MRRLILLLTAVLLLAGLASAQVTITTASLPDGYTNGLFYSQTLAASITPPLTTMNATLTWSIPTGALPPGLSLNTSTGAITGNPTTTGVYNFTVMVQINFTGFMDQRQLSLNINTPKLTITTNSPLPNVSLTENYQVQLQATAVPVLPISWSVGPNVLPPGLFMSPQGVISGIPQTIGTYTFTVGALLANTGVNDSRTFTIQVFAGRLQITSPSPLPPATAGQFYTYTLTSMPGSGVTWGSPVSLPGITLDPNTGILSGTPPITGTFNFIISASSPGFSPDSKSFSFSVIGGPLSVVESTLPLAILNASYSILLHVTGGLAPYQWRLTGSPPPGLTINLNSGVLTGQPTAVGQYNFLVQVTDATNTTISRNLSVFVAGPVVITTTSLPNAVAGAAYSQTLSAGGGQAPYTWSILSGNTPPGIQFSSSGTLTGLPTRNGFYTFTIQVSDNGQRTATQTLSITVGGISVSTAFLPDAGLGGAYLLNLQAAGGNPPFTWALTSGSLPPGLTLDPGGAIQGMATAVGSFQFTIQVTDATQSVSQRQLSINVAQPLQLSTTSLAGGGIGNSYSQVLSATGGTPPYTFALESGALPPGLSLDAASGTIFGTPTTGGTFTFGILLTDKGVQQVRRSLTIVIANSITISTGNLSGTAGAAYSQTLTATGGAAPYTWSLASGNLPSGLTLSSTGVISGTPTAAGSFKVTVAAKDSNNASAQQAITITIALPATPNVTVTLTPDTSSPAQQPQVGVTLSSAYPVDIIGNLTLTFQSSVGGDDQTVRFSNGSRSANFTISAGNTQAQLVMGSGPTVFPAPVNLLTGTTAGTIKMTASLQASGIDITPSPAPSKTTVIAASAPVISSVAIQSSGTTLTVIVTGYSTTRDMVSGLFHFAPASGSTVSQSDLTVQLGPAFSTWYGNSASTATGSQFTLTMPFTVSQGTAASITAVTVTLTNSKGASAAVSP